MDILSDLCAICLNSDTSNLSTTSTISYGVSYAEKINICIPQYISEHFHLGQCCLCDRCITQLDDFYKFLTTSLENKVRLEEMIVEYVCVKKEVEEEFMEESGFTEECNIGESTATVGEYLIDKVEEDPLQTVTCKSENVYESDGWNSDMIIFPCCICSVKFQTNIELIRHSVAHLDYRPFICECGRRFTQKSSLTIHQNFSKHTTNTIDEVFDGNFMCCICREKFSSNSRLVQHNQTHLKHLHECECGKKFSKKMNLTMHEKTCTHKAIWKSSENEMDDLSMNFCRICCEKFDTNSELSHHYASKHIRYHPYVCECGMEFTKKNILGTHQKNSNHGNYKMKTAIKMEDGTETIQIIEDVEKKLGCCICGKVFSNTNAFQRHTRRHVKFRMIVCECGDEFVSKNHLMRHQKVSKHVKFRIKTDAEANEVAKRNLCDSKTLALRIRSSTGKKTFSCITRQKRLEKVLRYTCKFCKKGFFTKNELNNHLESHKNDLDVNDENYTKPTLVFTKNQLKTDLEIHDPFEDTILNEHVKDRIELEASSETCREKCETVATSLTTHSNSKDISCDICHVKLPELSKLVTHMKTKHGKLPNYICNVCGRSFYMQCSFSAHLQTHNSQEDITCYACKEDYVKGRCECCEAFDSATNMNTCIFACECGKEFVKRVNLLRHRRVNNHVIYRIKSDTEGDKRNEMKKYRCKRCGKVFTSEYILRKHMTIHFGAKSFSCDMCHKKFSRLTTLTSHIKIHQNENELDDDGLLKNFKCYVCHDDFIENGCKCCEAFVANGILFVCECGREFVEQMSLQEHRKANNHVRYRIQSEPDATSEKTDTSLSIKSRKKQCTFCGKTFHKSSALNFHINKFHENTPKYTCNICGKTYRKSSTLDYHIKSVHEKNPNFICNICGKGYYTQQFLNFHLKTHSKERNLLCNICGKTFYDIRYLRRHMEWHSTKKPYPCQQCEKQFITPNRLRRHMNQKHLNVRPYVCDICNRGFVEPYILRKHKMKHSDYRPFSCLTCDATFKTERSLKRHILNKVCALLGKDTKIRKRTKAKQIAPNSEKLESNQT